MGRRWPVSSSASTVTVFSRAGDELTVHSFLRKVLNESPDNRVIVFSQWDAMLHRIGDTLSEAVRGGCHLISLQYLNGYPR